MDPCRNRLQTFKGSLTPTNAGEKAIAFKGAVLQKTTSAFGHFFGTSQSGDVGRRSHRKTSGYSEKAR